MPFTSNAALFIKLAKLGKRLIDLHLLKSAALDPPVCRFEGKGDGRVAKGKRDGLRYDSDAQRVYINPDQYFAPVPENVWTYQVGGYQVCHKWLKDRNVRKLGVDDIRIYCHIVTALQQTIEIQQEINELYTSTEEALVIFDDPEDS